MAGDATALRSLADAVRGSGLVSADSSGVVLVSGGADSACAAAALAGVCGSENVAALHIDYGLRETSARDVKICRELCAALRVDLRVEKVELPRGNVQGSAREVRYRAAERLRERVGLDWVATGHTRSDVAETVLYRLAASPGRRALLGMPARRGRLVRPLLGLSRPDTRRLARAAGLPFADDETNEDPRYARNRVRAEVMPVMREIGPAFERNVVITQAEIAEESAVLDRIVGEEIERLGAAAAGRVAAADLAELEPGLRRLILRELAEREAGGRVALGHERAVEIERLAAGAEGGTAELGGGVRALCEAGTIRFESGGPDVPQPVRLAVPGGVRFGIWELRAEVRSGSFRPASPEVATFDADALGTELEVRAWREGDRMQPLGLGGTKSLQDVFTDAKVPRSLRRTLPIVASGGRIAWVAGVAVSEEFKVGARTREVAVLTARSSK